MYLLKQWNVGIFVFDEVEILDFAGPYEVFSSVKYLNEKPFTVKTIAQSKDLINTRNGLKVTPDYDFSDAPHFDIIIIPGGHGTEEIEFNNTTVISWIKNRMKDVTIMASVCTGSFLLAKAGLLNGKSATTHWMDIDRLEKDYNVKIKKDVKFVDEDSIITSAGVSAGIDMSFYIVKKLLGKEVATNTAKWMEYDIEI
jgi:transcriptional regulator GlxA family with amidase domain